MGRWGEPEQVSGWYSIEQNRGARGRTTDLLGAEARVGEMGTLDAMLMTPGAIAAELDRINTSFVGHHNELLAAARAHGLTDPMIASAAVSGWFDVMKDLVTLNPAQAARDAAATMNDSAPHGPPMLDPITQKVLDASKLQNAQSSADPIVRLFIDGWLPLQKAWTTFYGQERGGSWWHNAGHDAEKYLAQLLQVRDRAEKLGVKFATPRPEDEHPGGRDWFSLVKYALIGTGVLGATYLIVRAVKK